VTVAVRVWDLMRRLRDRIAARARAVSHRWRRINCFRRVLRILGDGDEAFEFAGEVWAGGLVHDLGDAFAGVASELFGDVGRWSGDRAGRDRVPASGGPGGFVGAALPGC
jgi:hypothetical protein